MIIYLTCRRASISFRAVAVLTLLAFCAATLAVNLPKPTYASALPYMPVPTQLIDLSPHTDLPVVRGLQIHPEEPFKFDFIIEEGDGEFNTESFAAESERLIKYFLSSLTIPEEDLWVNLSPYQQDTIVPQELGLTELGKDLLGEDYVLKQLVASLTYPESPLGKLFWKKVYQRALTLFGTTNIPINTFNKIWIVPDKAVIYEEGNKAFIGEARLKVMLEEDYLALKNNLNNSRLKTDKLKETEVKDINNFSSQIMKEMVLPVIEEEINQGKNFAYLRQIYYSLLLAVWFKKKLRESVDNSPKSEVLSPKSGVDNRQSTGGHILGKIYVDKKKVKGVDVKDEQIKEKIYQQYLEAYKKGVYNYIKEDYDAPSQKYIQRRYYSGGFDATAASSAITIQPPPADFSSHIASSSLRKTQIKLLPMDRRRFLKTIGAGAAFSLVPWWVRNSQAGGGGVTNQEKTLLNKSDFTDVVREGKTTLGEITTYFLSSSNEQLNADNNVWSLFRHFLNTSQWLEAAEVFNEQKNYFNQIRSTVKKDSVLQFIDRLFLELEKLFINDKWQAVRKGFGEKTVRWFKSGTYPTFYDEATKSFESTDSLDFFKELDLWNNIYKNPATASNGAPIYSGGPHYWSLLGWEKAEKAGVFDSFSDGFLVKKVKNILVRFDGHQDLHNRIPADLLKALLSGNSSEEEIARIAQECDIDGFIIPAVYKGLIDEIVWAVPPEARDSSGEGYVPAYGSYELWLGRLKKFPEILATFSPDAASKSLGKSTFSRKFWESGEMEGIKKIKIHVVPAPTKSAYKGNKLLETIKEITKEGGNIILDIDPDFLGAKEPVASQPHGDLPNFEIDDKRFEDLIGGLEEFYNDPHINDKTKAITKARSPNFTDKVKERAITARLLAILIDSSRKQPRWAQDEQQLAKGQFGLAAAGIVENIREAQSASSAVGGKEEIAKFIRGREKVWVIFADMMKLSLRDQHHARRAADFFIEETLRIAQTTLMSHSGKAERSGERSDEMAMALSGELSGEQVEAVIQEIQQNIESEFKDYIFAEVPEGVPESAIEKIRVRSGVKSIEYIERSQPDSTEQAVGILFKSETAVNANTALTEMLKEVEVSDDIISRSRAHFVQIPYLPAGAVRVNADKNFSEVDLDNALARAEEYQGIAKQRKQLVGVEGIMELRAKPREERVLLDEEELKEAQANLAAARENLKSEQKAIREFVFNKVKAALSQDGKTAEEAERKAREEAEKIQVEEEYAVFIRSNLMAILEYAMQTRPAGIKTYLVRGPPDNFYVISVDEDIWQIKLVKQVIVPVDSSLKDAFTAIMQESRRQSREEGKFGFKVVNDHFGHTFGNQLITLDRLNLEGDSQNLNNQSLQENLDHARPKINTVTEKHGFRVELEATVISSSDFDGIPKPAFLLQMLGKLSNARNGEVKINSNINNTSRLKLYSENKEPSIWQSIENEWRQMQWYQSERAFEGLVEEDIDYIAAGLRKEDLPQLKERMRRFYSASIRQGDRIAVAVEKAKAVVQEPVRSSSALGETEWQNLTTASSAASSELPKGGIDLNPAHLDLEIRGARQTASPLNIPFDIGDFAGFTFQIIKIERIEQPQEIFSVPELVSVK